MSREQTLYISHNNRDDEPIATVRNVIVQHEHIGGVPIGTTFELHGSVFNQRKLQIVSRDQKLVTLKSGKITIQGHLEKIFLFRDKRYKTNRRFQTELRPTYDSRNAG